MTSEAAKISPDGKDIAVRILDLEKTFPGHQPVFSKLSLDIQVGQSVAFIGANGTGKSTLLKSIVRLNEVDRGDIHVFGQPVLSLRGEALRSYRSKVGFVFQRHNLVGRLCALSNTIHGAMGRDKSPRNWYQWSARSSIREEALHCLDRVGLADRALQRVDLLSGGQSQRVAIARMLMQKPQLVIADEPDASLDPRAGAEIMDLLLGLAREQHLTVLFVSHHMEHAIAFADRIIGLGEGKILLDQPSKDADLSELKNFFRVTE